MEISPTITFRGVRPSVGLEEDILPHRESIAKQQIEEERRLLYVGITRAQRSLCLSYTEKRKKGGEWQRVEPSRFIAELPQDEINFHSHKTTTQVTKQTGNQHLEQLRARLKQT